MEKTRVVCIGGGVGTSNLLRGLKNYTKNLTAIVSVADNGGSGGRIRRLYQMHPPGDIVSCLAALSDDERVAKLLTHRLPGDRYEEDHVLHGHKVGNIMLAAASQINGTFEGGISYIKELFQIQGNVYPATKSLVTLSARTVEGTIVEGEETIDLGNYDGSRVLSEVFIHPQNPQVDDKVIGALHTADLIVAGPGDLYTSLLPALIVPQIAQALMESDAKKIFVVNIANKPFETKGYSVEDFIKAVVNHLGSFPFAYVVINNNASLPIPSPYHYQYVSLDSKKPIPDHVRIIAGDVVDHAFPIYHDAEKLAKLIWKTI